MKIHEQALRLPVLVVLIIILCFAAATPVLGNYEVVVVLKENGVADNMAPAFRAGITDSIKGCNIFLVEMMDEMTLSQAIDALSKDPDVMYVEPNFPMELPENFQMSISFPDESLPPLLKDISPPDFYGLPAQYDLGTDEALQVTEGDGIVVAVIDNGLAYNHPLFQISTILPGKDFIDNDNEPAEKAGDAYGHGTFVTGLILLNAPACHIMPLRAFDKDGVGSSFSVARAIRWAATHNVRVVNMSFGMSTYSHLIQDACSFASNRNVVLVAASGNENSASPTYPASYPYVIAVSAIDEQEYRADFSNYGEYIDVCAPGVNLYSCLAGEFNWGTWSGTSFSAPLVSAACALSCAADPTVTPQRMERHLRKTARRNLAWGTISNPPDPEYGNGCIDIGAAVTTINNPDDILCGDADGNGIFNIADAHYVVNFVFRDAGVPASDACADVNCDGRVNEADANYMLNYLVKGGPAPCCWSR